MSGWPLWWRLLLISSLWGSAFPLMRFAVAAIPPWWLASGRALLAASAVALWLALRGRPVLPRGPMLRHALAAWGDADVSIFVGCYPNDPATHAAVAAIGSPVELCPRTPADCPAYDAATHRLTWSMRVKDANEGEEDAAINFNTRALGRDGYFSLNLVTDQNRIAQDSQVSAQLLSGLEYVDGKRYADFNAGTDRVAEYGLAALIGVAVAKKLGLLALAAAAERKALVRMSAGMF